MATTHIQNRPSILIKLPLIRRNLLFTPKNRQSNEQIIHPPRRNRILFDLKNRHLIPKFKAFSAYQERRHNDFTSLPSSAIKTRLL